MTIHAKLDDLPTLKTTIQQAGLAADKRLGQHFLLDPAILDRIARVADVGFGDHVLEIGPGPGGLTRALLAKGASVVAVERDHRCIEVLKPLQDWAAGQLQLIHADALKISPADVMDSQDCKIVANLPYNVGTELLTRWLSAPIGIQSIHVLMQREVVERIVAAPGTKAYGRLAILAQLTSQPVRRFDLPPGAFHPPPKVVSSLISLTPITDPPNARQLKSLQRLTQAAFGQRRKMLRTSLKGLNVPLEDLLEGSGVRAEQRPETLAPKTFLALSKRLFAIEESHRG